MNISMIVVGAGVLAMVTTGLVPAAGGPGGPGRTSGDTVVCRATGIEHVRKLDGTGNPSSPGRGAMDGTGVPRLDGTGSQGTGTGVPKLDGTGNPASPGNGGAAGTGTGVPKLDGTGSSHAHGGGTAGHHC